MSEKKGSGLLARYEQMLKEKGNYYFDADEWEEIAYQYELTDRYKDALEAINHGLSIHPGNISLNVKKARYLLDIDAIEEAEKLIYSLPNDSVDAILVRAEIHFIQSRPQKANLLLRNLLNSEEISCDLCFEIMDMYLDFGYFDELVEFVNEADNLLSDGSELLRELALIYEDKQDLNKSIEIYNKLIDRNPYSTVDWFNLAKVYALQKKYEKAIDACDFALTTKDDDENILSFKGYCLYDQGSYREAIDVFLEYAKVADEKSIAYELVAECYVKLEQNGEAIKYLNEALSLSPESSNLYYQLATNYYDMGNTPKTIECLIKTLEIDPEDAEALVFMGEIKVDEKKLDEAKQYLVRAFKIDSSNIDVLTLLGDIATEQEDIEESILYYEKALEINPYDVKLIFKLILAHYNTGNQDKAASLIKHLDESTLKIDDIEEISEENKNELKQTKEMLDKLRNILRKNLDENL